jgi:N-acetylglucosaminyldiphosphoundecaprenol N-acetyl-beta-D-mannosaminyltransferase
LGLEWLWRIKEEPLLAHRYARDGLALLTLLVAEVLPLVLQRAWLKLARVRETPLVIMREITDAGVTLRVSGSLCEEGANRLRSHLRHESRENPITLDVGGIDRVDTTGAGLLLLLQKHCRGERLRLLGAGSLRFMLRRHGIGFTLE